VEPSRATEPTFAGSLTGAKVRALRLRAGLKPGELAQLLGIHSVTVYRWETLPELHVEPFQQQLLALLDAELSRRTAQEATELRDSIRNGLLVGGTLLGLCRLLCARFGERAEPNEERG
jgi:transcriptional regulator with XRE-family HTH domain